MRAVAWFSEDVLIAQLHVVELQLTSVRGAPHHLAVHRALSVARSAVFDEKRSKLRLSVALAGYHLDSASECHRGGAVGDEYLCSVDNPLIINFLCSRFCSSRVAAGRLLGETEAPEMVFAEFREIFLFLFFGSVLFDRADTQRVVRRYGSCRGAVDTCKFLNSNDIRQSVESLSAVFLRHAHAQKSEFSHLLRQLDVEFLVLVVERRHRLHLFLSEFADFSAQFNLFFSQSEIHIPSSIKTVFVSTFSPSLTLIFKTLASLFATILFSIFIASTMQSIVP